MVGFTQIIEGKTRMILIPQIYLKNEKVVILEGTKSPIFKEDPILTMEALHDAGAEAIHVIDLGVPPVGASANLPLIKHIQDKIDIELYVGGGFKTTHAIEGYISAGVQLVILGSIAYQQPHFLEEASHKFPARVAVHIDVKSNRVTIPGYTVVANKTAFDYAEQFVGAGVRHFLYSDVGANGLMADEHYDRLEAFCKQVTARVICTSETGSLAEIIRIARLSLAAPRLDGLVLGRSVSDGRVDLRSTITMINDVMISGSDESTMTEM